MCTGRPTTSRAFASATSSVYPFSETLIGAPGGGGDGGGEGGGEGSGGDGGGGEGGGGADGGKLDRTQASTGVYALGSVDGSHV